MIPLLQASALAPRSTVTGRLEVLQIESRILGNSRAVRIWFPPTFDAKDARSYPVLVMHDGQNLFDGATSYIPGGEWRVDETATMLISAGLIRPLVIVGVDNAGAARGDEYLPTRFAFGKGEIGGRADLYLRMLEEELFPLLRSRFGLSIRRFGMAGSSLGGIVSLYAATKFGARLDRVAALSPSVWVNGREPLAWPARIPRTTRVWLDIGLSEGDEAVTGARALRDAFKRAGRKPIYAEEPNAEHNEGAWARRMPAVLMALYGSR